MAPGVSWSAQRTEGVEKLIENHRASPAGHGTCHVACQKCDPKVSPEMPRAPSPESRVPREPDSPPEAASSVKADHYTCLKRTRLSSTLILSPASYSIPAVCTPGTCAVLVDQRVHAQDHAQDIRQTPDGVLALWAPVAQKRWVAGMARDGEPRAASRQVYSERRSWRPRQVRGGTAGARRQRTNAHSGRVTSAHACRSVSRCAPESRGASAALPKHSLCHRCRCAKTRPESHEGCHSGSNSWCSALLKRQRMTHSESSKDATQPSDGSSSRTARGGHAVWCTRDCWRARRLAEREPPPLPPDREQIRRSCGSAHCARARSASCSQWTMAASRPHCPR